MPIDIGHMSGNININELKQELFREWSISQYECRLWCSIQGSLQSAMQTKIVEIFSF